MRRAFIFLLLFAPGMAFGAICKTVGADGVASFINVPGNECPAGSTLMYYPSSTVTGERVQAVEAGVSGRQIPFSGYQSVRITNPENGGSVRSNEGEVTVEVTLVPALRQSHFITLYLDEQAYSGRYGSSTIKLKGIERGTHTLRFKVLDSKGAPLIESESVSFTLQKHSEAIDPPVVVDPVTGDDFISKQEAKGLVPITGKVRDDVDIGAVVIIFATSEYKAELKEGAWKAEVPGRLLAKEAGFVVTAIGRGNDKYTTTKGISVERGGSQYSSNFGPGYSPEKPDYSPPPPGAPAAPSGQNNPAFKPSY